MNKVIFITGVASGIGKYLAEQLYQQGHYLIVSDINEEDLKLVAEENHWLAERIILQKHDVTKPEEWKNILQTTLLKFGKLDVLMNVAGVCQPGLIHETEFEKIHSQIDINLKGTIYGSKLAAEIMVKQKSGQIINIASIAGIVPSWGFNLYNAAKFGVRGFTLAIAYELREHNVFVSLVCPDAVETPMVKGMENNRAAAAVFSGKRTLSIVEIGQTILHKALIKKQLQVIHTVGFGRRILIQLGGLFPSISLGSIAEKIRQKGWLEQSKRQQKNG